MPVDMTEFWISFLGTVGEEIQIRAVDIVAISKESVITRGVEIKVQDGMSTFEAAMKKRNEEAESGTGPTEV